MTITLHAEVATNSPLPGQWGRPSALIRDVAGPHSSYVPQPATRPLAHHASATAEHRPCVTEPSGLCRFDSPPVLACQAAARKHGVRREDVHRDISPSAGHMAGRQRQADTAAMG